MKPTNRAYMPTALKAVFVLVLLIVTNTVTVAVVYYGISQIPYVPPGGPEIDEDVVIPPEDSSLENLRYLKTTAVMQYDFINNTIALVEFTHYRLAKNGWELNLSLENMVTLTKCNQWGTELRSCQLKVIGDRGVELYINYSYSYGNTWDTGNVYYGTVMFRPQDINGGYSVGAGYSIRYDTGPVGRARFLFEDSSKHLPDDPGHITRIGVGRVPTEEFPAVWGQ